MSSWNVKIIHLKYGYIEKILLYTMSYFLEPDSHSWYKILS